MTHCFYCGREIWHSALGPWQHAERESWGEGMVCQWPSPVDDAPSELKKAMGR